MRLAQAAAASAVPLKIMENIMSSYSRALREHFVQVFLNWDGPTDPNDTEARQSAEARADHFLITSSQITAAKRSREPKLRLVL